MSRFEQSGKIQWPLALMLAVASSVFLAGSFPDGLIASPVPGAQIGEGPRETLPELADAPRLPNSPMLPAQYGQMASLTDDQLSEVQGQALFNGDKIDGAALASTYGVTAPGTNFIFYRMGMDVELAMSANIGKLQLGCGGTNDALTATPACDVDLDYLTFMGRNGTQAGSALSEFILTRPYISIAVRDDNNPVSREVVGIKIGAQTVDGYLGVGRRYTSSGVNLENPTSPNCNTGAADGNGVLGCHSGVNSLSGFISAELSARFPVEVIGIVNGQACSGYLSPAFQSGTSSDCHDPNNRTFADIAGTRMTGLSLTNLSVSATGSITDWFSPLTVELNPDLRLLHGFAMVDTEDFFLSFQREQVSWPRFSLMPPPSNQINACNASVNAYAVPSRCSSPFAVATNTGWWMNVPDVKLVDIVGAQQSLGLGDVFNPVITNPELNSTPPGNCWSGSFC